MIVGEYEIVNEIGEGTSGVVYLGRHRMLDELVCIKKEKTGNTENIRAFAQEARLLFRLRHQSLICCKAYHELPEGNFMILAYAEGRTILDDAGNGAVADEHVCWILRRLLEALRYLHLRHRTVHGDISPRNVIVDIGKREATLIDFGLATPISFRSPHPKVGTPFFMAPEITTGSPPTPRTDIYGLGKLAIFLAGGDLKSGILPGDMHPQLKQIIWEMTRRNPHARPHDASAIISRIDGLRMESPETIPVRRSTREKRT